MLHSETLDHEVAAGLFFTALPINAALTSAMALLGPILAWLYDEPRVVLVAIAWAGITPTLPNAEP